MVNGDVTPAKAVAFGHILRSARENAGLAIDQIAQRLRIRLSLVLAIEAGLVNELPKRPYIDGHWKAYADLVAIRLPAWDSVRDTFVDAQPYLAEAETEAEPEAASGPVVAQPVRPARTGTGLRLPALALSGAALLGVGVIGFLSGQDQADPGTRVHPEAVHGSTIGAAASQAGAATPAQERPDPSAVQDVRLSPEPAITARAAAAADPSLPVQGPRPDPARNAQAAPPAAPEGNAEASRSLLSFDASGDSWIRLTIPAARRVLFARTLKAGDSVTVPVEPGMVLTLGAPANVAIRLDGRAVPLGSFVRQGIIREAPLAAIISAER